MPLPLSLLTALDPGFLPATILLAVVGVASVGMAADRAGRTKTRVVLDTDANNELDDQHAIAYLLFSGDVFDVKGITVNRTESGGDIHAHAEEAERVVKLCGFHGRVLVSKGADGSFREIEGHLDEPSYDGRAAVDFILQKAHEEGGRELVLLAIGKLTNIALALKKDPSVTPKVRVVWLGSNYPEPGEYNQDNDEAALSYLLTTDVAFEVVLVRHGRPSGTDAVRVTREEIRTGMAARGPRTAEPVPGRNGGEFERFGDYSVDLFEHIEPYGTPPSRALYDVAAVAIVKEPSWASPRRIPAPELVEGEWVGRPDNPRWITIWEDFDRDRILQDLFEKVAASE
jgi:purine nucleosidase